MSSTIDYSSLVKEALEQLRKDVKEHGHSWRYEHTHQGVEVKSTNRSQGETRIPVYKAKGVIPAQAEDVLHKAILSTDAIKQWSSVVDIEIIDTVNDTKFPGYQLYRQKHRPVLGGLVSPRDFSICRSYHIEENGEIFLVCFSIQDERIPEDWNFVRGHLHMVACHMLPIPDQPGHCETQYLVHTDIKGWLPAAIVSRGVLEEMTTTYARIANIVKPQ